MSGDSAQESTNTGNDTASTEVEAQEQRTSNASADDVAELKAALAKQEALIEKLRQHEQRSLEAEKAAKREKQTEVERVTEAYEQRLNEMALDAALEGELGKANARNIDLAKKVIDTNSINVVNGKVDRMSVREAIEALKASDNYLFNTNTVEPTVEKPKAAKPGRPTEGESEDIVQKEMKNAKSVKELNAIIRKYNVGAK